MNGPSGSRKCHVKKKESEEFEFFLKFDGNRNGQIITSVTKDGPAFRAGLKDGDRVIAINGNNVEDKEHSAIVLIIRECIPTHEIAFIVVDAKNDPRASQPKKKADSDVDPRPRICKIKKKDNSFGFFLEAHGDSNPGHFIKKVTKNGAADGSGLQDGDRVIAVNKTNVDSEKHNQVVGLIKKSGNKVTLLVIDEDGYQILKKKKIQITEKLAKSSSASVKPSQKSSKKNKAAAPKSTKESAIKSPDHEHKGKVRVIHLLKHSTKGYGFFLRAKKGTSGEYAGDVEKDGSADVCGILNNDRVVAVNGKDIMEMMHADVISLIKSKDSQVVLVVMDDAASKNFEEKKGYPTDDDIVRAHSHLIRSVQLTKGDGGYGMYLKMEKGCPFHIFADVESGGVAHLAGLKDGEILVAVEGSSVLTETHEECVNKIKSAGNSVEMIIGSRAASEFLHKTGVSISLKLLKEWPTEEELSVPKFVKPVQEQKVEESKPLVKAAVAVAVVAQAVDKDKDLGMKPRLCIIKRRDGGFGFFLKDDNGHFLINVEKNGPAFCAGALDYDRVVEINRTNVEKVPHAEVVQTIRESGDTVTFLVVNKEEDKFFQNKGIAITASLLYMSDDLTDEHKPRKCTLIRSATGYGFHLMAGPDNQGQFIKAVAAGGAAEAAGVKQGDRIIEVNDINVVGASHDTIVSKIKENTEEVTFLVIDKEGESYYKLKNIAIVASLIVVKNNLENQEAEKISIGRVSASSSSSIVEIEASVHQDAENEVDREIGEKVVKIAAVVAVSEAIEEVRKESDTESLQDRVEDAIEEVKDAIEDAGEEIEDLERRELEPIEKAAVAIAAVAIVDEIRDEINETMEEADKSDIESVVSDVIEVLEDKRKEEDEQIDVTDAIEEKVRENIDDADEGLEPAGKVIAAAVAVKVIKEVVENGDVTDAIEEVNEKVRENIDDADEGLEPAGKVIAAAVAVKVIKEVVESGDAKSESHDSQPPTPEPSLTKEDAPHEELIDAIEDKIEDNKKDEEEEKDNMELVAKAAILKMNSEIAEKFNEKEDASSSEDEEEPVAVVTPIVIPPSPERSPSPKIIELPKATIIVVPQPVRAREEETSSKPDVVPLAAILTQNGEIPNLKTTPQKQNQTKIIWGQHQLKTVNRTPVVVASSPKKEEDDAPPVMSSVRALRAALEQKNRESKQDYRKNDAKSELSELSKQGSGISKHAQMFGGSTKKTQQNGAPKKNKWTGEGMTIKIVET